MTMQKFNKHTLRHNTYKKITIVEVYHQTISIKHLKEYLPIKLAERNLIINKTKTEEYEMSRTNLKPSWKNCKLLGSLLDTANDMKHRKAEQ